MNQTEAFIKSLGDWRGILPAQTLKTIRGQALSGDLSGAKNGLNRAVTRLAQNPAQPAHQKGCVSNNENHTRWNSP